MELYDQLMREYRGASELLLRRMEIETPSQPGEFNEEKFHELYRALRDMKLVTTEVLAEIGFDSTKLDDWYASAAYCISGPFGEIVIQLFLKVAQESLSKYPIPEPVYPPEKVVRRRHRKNPPAAVQFEAPSGFTLPPHIKLTAALSELPGWNRKIPRNVRDRLERYDLTTVELLLKSIKSEDISLALDNDEQGLVFQKLRQLGFDGLL